MTKIEIGQISGIGKLLFVICLLAGAVVTAATKYPAGIVVGALLGIYLLFAIKVVRQWEKVAVLRLGRYVGLRGPGVFHIIPIVETLSPYVDQRVRVANVSAESTLTRDTVPVNVDAIIFWMVWNAEKSILEVENFIEAINMSAQTALRESIGRHELAQMITERETLGRELQRILDEKTNPWGITVQSVEIRDVRIPQGLEDAMSRQAQAERERQARIILGQAETEISNSFVQAAAAYAENPVALHLRAMNMLYEAIKEKGSMVIVPSRDRIARRSEGTVTNEWKQIEGHERRKPMNWLNTHFARLKDRVRSVAILAVVSTMCAAPRSTAQAMQPGIRVELAHTSSAVPAPDADSQNALIVTVTESGKLYLGIDPIAPDSLAEKFKALPARTQNLYLKADARAPYASVVRVLDAAHAANIANITLLTSQPKTAQGEAVVLPEGIEIELARRSPAATH
jgi:regulator of protease activity HflC (stomatin/prohibitin superfamily)/biopolymer transport protein ExbD